MKTGIRGEHRSYFSLDGLYGGGYMDAELLCEDLVVMLGIVWWVVEMRVCDKNVGGEVVIEGVVIEFWGEDDRDFYLECRDGGARLGGKNG